MKKFFIYIFIIFIISGCSSKQPLVSRSGLVVIKTPKFKIADFGFITKYPNFINLKIFNAGSVVFDIDVYKNKVCFSDSVLKCIDAKEFNKKYLAKQHYKQDFLYNLLLQQKVYFKDKDLLIKIRGNNG